MKNKGSNKKTKRLIPMAALLVAFSVVVSVTLVNYQIVRKDEFTKLATQNKSIKQTTFSARGEICDRYGRKLVTNKLALDLHIGIGFPYTSTSMSKEETASKNKEGNKIILNLIELFEKNNAPWVDDFPISEETPYEFMENKEKEIQRLKTVLKRQEYATADNCMSVLKQMYNIEGYTAQETRKIAAVRAQMLETESSSSNPYVFAKDVNSSLASTVVEMKSHFPGANIQEVSQRQYPSGDIAPHILGSVGPIYAEEAEDYKKKNYSLNAVVGKTGIEKAFEQELRGNDGEKTYVFNSDGQCVEEYYDEGKEPKPGNTIKLSIDANFQKQLQDALAAYVKSHSSQYASSKGAGLAVIDVNTGETLALVSYPGYDINDYNKDYDKLTSDPLKPLKNRAIMEIYRPGSTFKTFMSAAGQLNGTINSGTYFNCVNPFPGTNMKCLQSHHSGMTNIYTALQYSCNNYFYNTAKNMGIDAINEYAPYFGFGTDSGLEILNADGRVTNPKYYEKYGQEFRVGFVYQTGIGQAEVFATPLQMAISMMTIANHGTRYESHLVHSIDKFDGSAVVSKTEPKVLSQLPKDSPAYDVTMQGMKLMAQTRPALQSIDIAAKSGSPQYDERNTNLTNAAAVGVYPASKPEIGIGLLIEDGASAQDFFKEIAQIYESCKNEKP